MEGMISLKNKTMNSSSRKEDLFHVIHKVPQGDTPYGKAKHAQVYL